jgi:hypothetical protein
LQSDNIDTTVDRDGCDAAFKNMFDPDPSSFESNISGICGGLYEKDNCLSYSVCNWDTKCNPNVSYQTQLNELNKNCNDLSREMCSNNKNCTNLDNMCAASLISEMNLFNKQDCTNLIKDEYNNYKKTNTINTQKESYIAQAYKDIETKECGIVYEGVIQQLYGSV